MIALNRFVEFNTVKFLQDSRHWKSRKKRLQDELDAITEIKGRADGSPGHSGKISDTTGSVAAERMRLETRIKRIEQYEEALAYGRSTLSEEQNAVLDAFFFDGGYISHNVDVLAYTFDVTPRSIYTMRREAIDSLQRIITETYFE